MGTAYPPDQWGVLAGTWGTNIDQESSITFSGPYSIKFFTGAGLNTYLIQDDYIPIGDSESLAMLVAVRADGNDVGENIEFGVKMYDKDKTLLATNTDDYPVTAVDTWEIKQFISNFSSGTAFIRPYFGKQDGSFNAYFGLIDPRFMPNSFSCYQSAATTLADLDWTKVTNWAEEYDYGGHFASDKYTAAHTGIYHFDAAVKIDNPADNKEFGIALKKNGSFIRYGSYANYGSADYPTPVLSADIPLDLGDYVEVYVYNGDSVDRDTYDGATHTWFSGHEI